MRSHPVRIVAAVALVTYALLAAAVLLSTHSTVATEVIALTKASLIAHGAPDWMTYGARVELALNAALFTPLAFLASITHPRHPWGNWVAYAFTGSGAVEVFQAFVLEPRSAQYVDVVANTLGALIGALVALPLTMSMRRTEFTARGSNLAATANQMHPDRKDRPRP